MQIREDNLLGTEIANFLQQHIADMRSVSPPESSHTLDLMDLRKPQITFWTMRDGDDLVGCGAIKRLSNLHAEVKSMRIAALARKRGFASYLLQYLIKASLQRGYQRLSLETGSMHFFEPARRLYEKFGFAYCEPFNGYKEDPNSVFMSLPLADRNSTGEPV